jgi:hypothetical protein
MTMKLNYIKYPICVKCIITVASAHARECSFCCVYGQLVAMKEMTERRFLGDGSEVG